MEHHTFTRPEYPTYEEREEVKSRGWKLYWLEEDVTQKVNILLNTVVWAHYWRAREAIEGSPMVRQLLKKMMGRKYDIDYTLEFDHYISH